jgi:DNA-binding NarL/FixJ family response regulator
VTLFADPPHIRNVPATSKTARVLLVDDNPAIIAQVTWALSGRFQITGTLPDGSNLDAVITEQKPDVIVLDITLPGDNGLVIARRLRSAACTAHIVFLTVHADADYARAAFAAGALGYVTKSRIATDLIVALDLAVEGRRFVSPGVGFDASEL